jgi:glycolate oxidase FAD binding subunit
LVVGLEGTRPEVAWMSDALLVHWRASGLQPAPLDRESAGALWSRLVEFPQAEPAPMVLKLVVRSSRLIELVGLVRELDPEASLACQAGNGVATARMARLPQAGLSRWLVGRLQPAAQQAGGHVVVLSAEGSAELTRQAVWGAAGEAVMLMEAVKQQFDPKNVLNPGRFVYPG